MTDRLDLVAIQVADIGAVIIGMVMGAKARLTLITAAVGQGGGAVGGQEAVWLPLPTLAGCLLWGGKI